ncbi:hypothetical protein JGUZn3_09660 [Entomobacter blattae]|uniref:Uncharacterized protein n=1 Tax=Entomobacter blattae TaxID=2762277 RepID=A0A7H1NQY7_9PROT|nr:hypothetical protein JGUZn3_09660 [Entomobacter blattae]
MGFVIQWTLEVAKLMQKVAKLAKETRLMQENTALRLKVGPRYTSMHKIALGPCSPRSTLYRLENSCSGKPSSKTRSCTILVPYKLETPNIGLIEDIICCIVWREPDSLQR